ncbi:unnamed protein product [Lactuca saligna]|nr:unnamed protein product [Lactuca saligna]
MGFVPVTLRTAVVFLCFFSAVAKFKTLNRTYPYFNNSMTTEAKAELILQNHAVLNQDALQVTPDSANPLVFGLQNQSGRVMFHQRFKLWDGDVNSNSAVASFNTSFLVNMFPNNGTPGEGLAFLIAPTIDIPQNSYGQYLGLTNATTDNQTSNGIVAVELDTVQQNFDIDKNHKYNGDEKIIRIYIAKQEGKDDPTPPMPENPIIERKLDLRTTVNQHSYFGFAASTGTLIQLNCVRRWNLTVTYIPEPKGPLMTIFYSALGFRWWWGWWRWRRISVTIYTRKGW